MEITDWEMSIIDVEETLATMHKDRGILNPPKISYAMDWERPVRRINQLGYKCFVGGSRLFGYCTPQSDLDIIICAPTHSPLREFIDTHIKKPLSLTVLDPTNPNTLKKIDGYASDSVVAISNDPTLTDVHFVFYTEYSFQLMLREHVNICKMLSTNRALYLFLLKLYREGKGNLTGGKVFQMLSQITVDF